MVGMMAPDVNQRGGDGQSCCMRLAKQLREFGLLDAEQFRQLLDSHRLRIDIR
jgi:hypothetical protein